MNLLIDFDSTICSKEMLEEIFSLVLAEDPNKARTVEKISNITNMGMNGEISYSESISTRIALLPMTTAQIQPVIDLISESISASFPPVAKDLLRHKLYVLSGGFREIIIPVLAQFGIDQASIFANTLQFSEEKLIGVDSENPLAHDSGKVKIAQKLKLSGKTIAVGDGYSDLQLKLKGIADTFIYYNEHVHRQKIQDEADYIVNDFNELRELLNSGDLTQLENSN